MRPVLPLLYILSLPLIGYSDNQAVLTMSIDSINSIAITNSAHIFIDPSNVLPDGSIYGDSSDTSYGCLTNDNKLKKITARLDAAMPAQVVLKATLTAPTGATSNASQTLTTTDVTLITNIPAFTNQSNLTINYRAESSPSITPLIVRRVIYTFTDQ